MLTSLSEWPRKSKLSSWKLSSDPHKRVLFKAFTRMQNSRMTFLNSMTSLINRRIISMKNKMKKIKMKYMSSDIHRQGSQSNTSCKSTLEKQGDKMKSLGDPFLLLVLHLSQGLLHQDCQDLQNTQELPDHQKERCPRKGCPKKLQANKFFFFFSFFFLFFLFFSFFSFFFLFLRYRNSILRYLKKEIPTCS